MIHIFGIHSTLSSLLLLAQKHKLGHSYSNSHSYSNFNKLFFDTFERWVNSMSCSTWMQMLG